MVSLTRVLCVAALLILLAGFAGSVHPLGDSLVVFAVPAAVLVALTIWFTGWHWRVILILAFSVVALLAVRLVALADRGDAPEDALVLYQKNMRYEARDRSDLLADIKASGAGVVTLQEVSEPNAAVLKALSDRMPSQLLCPGAPTGGVAVLSSLPRGPAEPVCAGDDRMAALQVMTVDGPVWLVSLHLRWPWPQDQARQAERLATRLQSLEGRVIVSGDFNNTHWSYSLRRIGDATRTRRIHPVQPSFTLPYLPIGITIDHILVPNDIAGQVIRRPKFASDHHGLVARIGISPR
ncbi:Endonuclease/Exonuclease/phosphatase family protein [Marinibacterium anthonyi]|nr:Endonuclease/Exonuclease/phosphatase family protein [Marinibacterium anthonyi]